MSQLGVFCSLARFHLLYPACLRQQICFSFCILLKLTSTATIAREPEEVRLGDDVLRTEVSGACHGPPMNCSGALAQSNVSVESGADQMSASNALSWFLATAPSYLPNVVRDPTTQDEWARDTQLCPAFHRLRLPTGEHVSCILWAGLHYITGTDIVRILSFRFSMLGRTIQNSKKFEEGVFSDLRHLRPGSGAILEESRVS